MGTKTESLESRRVNVGNQLFHYWASVNPSNKNLPPIILVHGLGVSSRYMIPLAERLAPDRTVYAPDLPGVGRSDKPAHPLNIEELAEALISWMEAVGVGRAVLLANSIGCQVVVDLALRRPELVEQLVLVSPTVDSRARTPFRSFARLLLDIPHERPSLCFIALLDYLQAGVGRTAHTFGYAIQDRIEEKLPGLRQPVLVVRGRLDPVVPERWAKEVNRLLPDGRLIVIRSAGHAVNYNSPEEMAQVVRDFLRA
ncbi:MAG TPA: alpha/beta hydrolase [Pyrinomonadaceae bacterium]|nr:alpha/beta hydrolase [Pyrinomonadaceae bacterium]